MRSKEAAWLGNINNINKLRQQQRQEPAARRRRRPRELAEAKLDALQVQSGPAWRCTCPIQVQIGACWARSAQLGAVALKFALSSP